MRTTHLRLNSKDKGLGKSKFGLDISGQRVGDEGGVITKDHNHGMFSAGTA